MITDLQIQDSSYQNPSILNCQYRLPVHIKLHKFKSQYDAERASLVAQLVGPWIGKICWRREWLPTPIFWPGKFHGLGHKESDTTEWLSLSLHYAVKFLITNSLSLPVIGLFRFSISFQGQESSLANSTTFFLIIINASPSKIIPKNLRDGNTS